MTKLVRATLSSGKCPRCTSEQVEGGFIDVNGTIASQEMFCTNCDLQYVDSYKYADSWYILEEEYET